MEELGRTTDPVDLVPGCPASVRRDCTRLVDTARSFEQIAEQLRAVRTPGWEGSACDAFWSSFDEQPKRWRATADALHVAADALAAYAAVLAHAQYDAADAIELWQRGQAATEEAAHRHNVAVARYNAELGAGGSPALPSVVDPGAELRRRAVDLLADARDRVREAGDEAAERLTRIPVGDLRFTRDDAAGWSGATGNAPPPSWP